MFVFLVYVRIMGRVVRISWSCIIAFVFMVIRYGRRFYFLSFMV